MIASTDRSIADAVADFEAGALEVPIEYPGAKGDENGTKGTDKGKGSRWNAVRHGCMAKTLIPADLESEVQQCTVILTEQYRPTSAFEIKAIANMGRLAAQLERNQKMQVVDLQRTMDRALLCWDDDREIYIDTLVSKLGTVPGVARALARSKQGAVWLLQTWMGLSFVLDTNSTWDADQRRLALDLIDMRHELHSGNGMITAETDAADLARIVKEEMDHLERRLESYLIATDDAARSMSAAGMPLEEDAETKRLRKQEARLKLDYRRAKAELLESRAQAAAQAAGPAPAPVSASTPTQSPVISSTRAEADEETGPRPRPKTSNAAYNFLMKRSMLDAFDVPATAMSPAQRVAVQIPFPGGDPQPQPVPESERESELETETEADVDDEPVSSAEPGAVLPPKTCVGSHASRAAVANQQRDRDRQMRRAREKKARKAARRNRR
jgi:hypothetical protein